MKKTISLAACALLAPTLASAEISSPRQIADRPSAHCQAPRWSPDAQQIAFDVYNPKKDTRETWIARFTPDLRKQGEDEVTTGRSAASAMLGGKKAPIVELTWAPDMKLLSKPYVFSSRGPKKNFDLFADGTWLTANNPGNDGQPAWSGDGRFIAYASQRKQSGDIYVIDLAGDPEKPLQATAFEGSTEFRPRWSPTKGYLLFTRNRSEKGQDIGLVIDVTRPADTTKMITDWTGDEIRPSWSPDGRRVAFYSNKGNRSDKVFDLWVIDINGENATKLADDIVVDDHDGPQWTPDGQTLLYVKRDFKRNNPVMWVRTDGSAKGKLKTGTQLNSDLSLVARGDTLMLAFKALGQTGSNNKTWERLFVVTFTAADLTAE